MVALLFKTLYQLGIDTDAVERIRVSPEIFKRSFQVEDAPAGGTNISHRGVPIIVDPDLDEYGVRVDSPVTLVETTVSVSSA